MDLAWLDDVLPTPTSYDCPIMGDMLGYCDGIELFDSGDTFLSELSMNMDTPVNSSLPPAHAIAIPLNPPPFHIASDAPIPALYSIQSAIEIDLTDEEMRFFRDLHMPPPVPPSAFQSRSALKKVCSVDKCRRLARAKGLCSRHGAQKNACRTAPSSGGLCMNSHTAVVDPVQPYATHQGDRCSAVGCTKGVVSNGSCRKHGGLCRA